MNETHQTEDRLRGHFYSLMARLLAVPPDRPLLELLGRIPSGASEGRMAKAWTDLRAAALKADPEAETAEYDRLFHGIAGRSVMPYASWYRTGFLAGMPLVTLRADLHRLGIRKAPEGVEPEDHAAALCEVMAMICQDSHHDSSEQAAFFGRHLNPWMPSFCSDLTGAAETDFYKATGRIGTIFFQMEREYLGFHTETDDTRFSPDQQSFTRKEIR